MWLLKTIDELNSAGVPRMRVLPNQFLNGEPVDTTLNVFCSNIPRMDNPIGTVFETDHLEFESRVSELNKLGEPPFYIASKEIRVHKPNN